MKGVEESGSADFPFSAFELIDLTVGIEGSIHFELAKLFVRQLADVSGFPLAQYIEGVHASLLAMGRFRERSGFCSKRTEGYAAATYSSR
jgi:hypothetical protein